MIFLQETAEEAKGGDGRLPRIRLVDDLKQEGREEREGDQLLLFPVFPNFLFKSSETGI